ncbi:hypothetical protein GCM10010412_067980 [Nonomuraea recticatena]|uniref:Uncharacterized protein n=1 Tax=Nonomuraea recticatena TaxID=46178 RepID=A0ABN3STJ2_9ACTN
MAASMSSTENPLNAFVSRNISSPPLLRGVLIADLDVPHAPVDRGGERTAVAFLRLGRTHDGIGSMRASAASMFSITRPGSVPPVRHFGRAAVGPWGGWAHGAHAGAPAGSSPHRRSPPPGVGTGRTVERKRNPAIPKATSSLSEP